MTEYRHTQAQLEADSPSDDGAAMASQIRLGSRRGRGIIVAAVLGSALAYMSDDMLNVALPTISRDLAVGVTEVQWVVNAYFVVMLSLILTAGSIGDIKGHRRMFLAGLAVFTSGAVVAAAAPGIPMLVVGRAVQGSGAAFLLASGLTLVSASFPDDERGRAVGLYMGLTAVATAAGPMIGGVLVDAFSWRAIFVAPLVFPAAAAAVTLARVPETALAIDRRADAAGAGLAFVAISSFSFVLIEGPGGWARPQVLGGVILATAAAALFLRLQRRQPDPMLPLHLFRIRRFSGGNAVTLIAYMVSAGVFFFLVVQLQTTLAYEPVVAGAALVPLYVVMLIGSPLAGRLADHVGARLPVVGGLCLLAAGIWWLSLVASGAQFWADIFPGLMLVSVGTALLGAPLTAATLGSVGSDDQGVASGVNNTVGQLAGLLMIVVLPAAAGLSQEQLHGPGFSSGYMTALQVCAALSLIAAALAALTLTDRSTRQRDGGTAELSTAGPWRDSGRPKSSQPPAPKALELNSTSRRR